MSQDYTKVSSSITKGAWVILRSGGGVMNFGSSGPWKYCLYADQAQESLPG